MTVHIEIRNHAYVYSEGFKGVGGLPYGTSGKGVLLLSGGIDSPVAGFLMARRGLDVVAVHFHSPPHTSERAKEKTADIARRLAFYTGSVKLYAVRFSDVQLYLYKNVPTDKLTIHLKRAMLRISEIIALREHAQCLITGDSVGQVASQTAQGILASESAAALPVLRPLCGMDKQEITNIAKDIGTFPISILPFDDCCTLFVAKNPESRPKASVIEAIESRLPELSDLCENAADTAEINEYLFP